MKSIRLIAAALAMLIVCGTGIAFAAQDGSESEDSSQASALSEAPQESAGTELASKRTATSDTFRLPDGALETKVFDSSINYRDAEGGWQPIGEGLEELAGGGLTNGPNSFDLRLPEALGDGPTRLSVDGEWVSAELVGAPTEEAQVKGDTASYESSDGARSFDVTSLPTGMKEDIEIADASQTNSFEFELDASNGLAPSVAEDGSIEFRDADNQPVVVLPAPTISDSSPGASANSNAVHYLLSSESDGHWRLTVQADPSWLQAPGRQFPVTIDPTMTIPAPSLDCTFGSLPAPDGWHGCGVTGRQDLQAAYSQKENQPVHSLLRFDLGSVPSTAYVTEASLGLYAPADAENTAAVQLRRATKPWAKSLTWRYYSVSGDQNNPQQLPWTTPGGDYTSEGTEILTSQRGSQAGWWNFSSTGLTEIVRGWATHEIENNGLLVKNSNESKAECEANPAKCNRRFVAFDSSAVPNTSLRPSLSITYQPPAPATSQLTSPTEGTRTARRLKLKVAWSVQGTTGVTFQYRTRDQNVGPFKTIPTSLVRNAKGESPTWPYAVSGNQSEPLYFDAAHATSSLEAKGGDIEVRALFAGSVGASGYSTPAKATVNRFIGGTHDATASIGPGSVDLLTGNYTVARTDVSIPGFGSALEFARTHNSRAAATADTGVLGRGWVPSAPVEAAGGSEWQKIREFVPSAEEKEEGLGEYAILTSLEGYEYAFELTASGYLSPPEASGWILSRQDATHLALTDPSGSRTVFEKEPSGADYVPVSISQTGSGNQTRLVYNFVGGKKRLSEMVAPAAAGINCETSPTTTLGCRVLTLAYVPATTWGAPSSFGDRLSAITYYGATNKTQMGNWEVAKYCYNNEGRLTQEWDPRLSPGATCAAPPALKEEYTYKAAGQIATLKPAGQEPWSFDYYGAYDGEEANGRLMDVKRASLVASPSVAQTTVAYGVPIGGPYDMSGAAVGKWGQKDIPVDATAIYPPDEVPSSPPSSYARATVYYMDAEAQLVNTATPSGAGTEAPSITTSEPDEHGNIVRELTAQNRLRALAAGAGSVAKAEELETKRRFSADGTEMQEEWGSLHQVRLASGETKPARLHRTIEYDTENGTKAPPPPAGTPQYHLPTRETTGASIVGQGEDADQRVTETKYNWTLRKPIESIVDPGGAEHLNLRTRIEYDPVSGLPTERSLPANPTGGDAHTTKITYYHPGTGSGACESSAWANLPCETAPAAQIKSEERPELLVTKFASYNQLGEPTEVSEGLPGADQNSSRVTVTAYDSAGRQTLKHQTGGQGASIPYVQTLYSSTNGQPTTQKFVLCGGCDNQAVTTTYDALGRPYGYEDADGNLSSTTYDLDGRPVTTSDGKGIQTRTYDSVSGLLVKLEDSGAGTFTAAYDADGNLVEEGLPDGLLAKTTYDETGQPTHLSYEKKTFCTTGCTWLDFGAERSIYGQVLAQSSLASSQQYSYDKAGRLTTVRDTPQGGGCTTRSYSFDADSNRTALVTRQPVGGACDFASEGNKQTYSYDAGDRLTGGGIVYDNFGRITSLPAADAGGTALTSTFYINDLVKSQTQGAITNTYELDGALRQRTRIETGGSEPGTEVYHYASGSDSPAWIDRGSSWSRNIIGIGGGLAAIQDSTKGTTLQLTNLHGDIVATASTNPEATKLLASFEFDEFGNPKSGVAGKYGWLGGKGRRTEFPSGIVQMGVRSYVPTMGRFISTDPVAGGSDAYDYANADPVNGLDLSGEKACKVVGPHISQVNHGHAQRNVVARVSGATLCTGHAKNIRFKVDILGGELSTFPQPTRYLPSQKGATTTCGDGGTHMATCEADASISFETHNVCDQTSYGSLVARFEVSWTTKKGNEAHAVRQVELPFEVTRACSSSET